MAVDRNRLEQEAMRFLQKGQTEKAIAHYQKILRIDTRDRRIRQKLAELYLAAGRHSDAERYFRDIANHLVGAGQERAAIAVVKQLVKLRPDEAELQELLGDCYQASGFPLDAKAAYKTAVGMYRPRPDLAVKVLDKLIRLEPGELPLKIQMAEILEKANWMDRARDQWLVLAAEAVRLGRPDERARFLEQALRLRTRLDTTLDAAEARLAMGDARAALTHLQAAYALDTTVARTLMLLGRALEDLGQPAKARPIWKRAVSLLEDGLDPESLAHAIRRALACGAKDPELSARLEEADRRVEAQRLRLHTQDWAGPVDATLDREVVRAEVQVRYGFPDRALETLDALGKDEASRLPAQVLRAEILVELGRVDDAVHVLRGLRLPNAEAEAQRTVRLQVLSGAAAGGDQAPEDEEVLDDDLLDDELLDDELDDDELSEGSHEEEDLPEDETEPPNDAGQTADTTVRAAAAQELAESGQVEAAIAAWREILADHPSNDQALLRIAELMSGVYDPPEAAEPASKTPEPEPDFGSLMRHGGTFAEIDPAEEDDEFDFGFGGSLPPSPPTPSPVAAPSTDEGLDDVDALLLVDAGEAAAARLGGRDDLEAEIRRARCRQLAGDGRAALRALRDALDDAGEADPAYGRGLFAAAVLAAGVGRTRAAQRLVDEIRDLDLGAGLPELSRLERALELLDG